MRRIKRKHELGFLLLQWDATAKKRCFKWESHFCLSTESGNSLKGHRWTHERESCSVMSDSLRPHGLYTVHGILHARILVGILSLLQGIFTIQELNSFLPRCRQILYQLSHQKSPRILEWVAYPFSRGSSQWTCVSLLWCCCYYYFKVVIV